MIALALAAAIACSTSSGKLTLVRPMPFEEVAAYRLADSLSWYAFALEGERVQWPSRQALRVRFADGRVVRARRILANWTDSFDTQEFGGWRAVDVPRGEFSGSISRRTGKWGTMIAAGFDHAFPVDSVAALQVGIAAHAEVP